MFTGLVREMATVISYTSSVLTLKAQYKPNIGDSIAINGACLTVISIGSGIFSVELSIESTTTLAMENYKNKVHIEPAMKMGDRFEGHIVQGHIDTLGTIKEIKNSGNSYDVFIKVDKKCIPYIIPKGSITIDGVSLTINDGFDDYFNGENEKSNKEYDATKRKRKIVPSWKAEYSWLVVNDTEELSLNVSDLPILLIHNAQHSVFCKLDIIH